MTEPLGIRCIQITAMGARAVIIGPDHPEYEVGKRAFSMTGTSSSAKR